MVKAIVGEETQLQLVEDHLSQSSTLAQVGLVIGKLSSSLDRGFVFDLVPTPNNDAGEPACLIIDPGRDEKKKKGSSSKGKSQVSADSSTLFVDKDWVAEHARQVSRMLVGGIKVIGLFIWVSDTAFKNSTTVLCEVLKSVAEAAPFSETAHSERLLIHVCYSPRRWTCRNCTIASNMTSSNLRPCDFKMGKVLGSLQRFRCSYNFNIRLPVSRKSMSHIRILSDALQRGISVIAKELRGAKALVDGNLVVEDETCTSDGFHDVELLLPFMNDTSIEACSLEDIIGVLVFSGSVSSFAFLTSKEPISQAITDIKGDIITSLQSRLDIICDEADGDIHPNESTNETSNEKAVSQTDLQSLEKSVQLPFPRRVFAPWLSGTYICDYLQPSETLEVLKEHCSELLSMEVKTDESSCILEPEQEAPLLVTKTFWDAVASSPSASSTSSSRDLRIDSSKLNQAADFKSTNFSTVAAVLVLLISIIVGYLLFARTS